MTVVRSVRARNASRIGDAQEPESTGEGLIDGPSGSIGRRAHATLTADAGSRARHVDGILSAMFFSSGERMSAHAGAHS